MGVRIPFSRRSDDHHLGPLAEYSALRAEIIHLMDQQWKVTAFLITTSGAVFGFAFTSAARMPLLLIIPFSSNILAARWIGCQQLVERISRYITTELDPHVPGGIGYEKWLRDVPVEPFGIRRLVGYVLRSPMVVVFPALAVLALTSVAWWYSFSGLAWTDPAVVPGLAAWAAGTILTLLSLRLLWIAAKTRSVSNFFRWRAISS